MNEVEAAKAATVADAQRIQKQLVAESESVRLHQHAVEIERQQTLSIQPESTRTSR